MAAGDMPLGNGPESQGVNFVLSVQDFGSDILNRAQKAYQALLDTMRKVGTQTDKFTTDILGKLSRAATVDKANGGVAPVITPFTMNQKSLDLMPKFVKASYDWLRNSAAGMTEWAAATGLAASRERDLRDSIAQVGDTANKYKDKLSQFGTATKNALGGALGKAIGVAGGLADTFVAASIHVWESFYEAVHDAGIQLGMTDKQILDWSGHLIKTAADSNVAAESVANLALGYASLHIPISELNDALLVTSSMIAEISKHKPGGAIGEDQLSQTVGSWINVLNLKSEQAQKVMAEAMGASLSSSIGLNEAMAVLSANTRNIDAITATMTPAQRGVMATRMAPQLITQEAAAKQAGMDSGSTDRILRGFLQRDTQDAHWLQAVLGQRYEQLRQQVMQGDLTNAFKITNEMVAKQAQTLGKDSTQLKIFAEAFGQTPDNVLRWAHVNDYVANIAKNTDLTSKSAEEITRRIQDAYDRANRTPEGQRRLIGNRIREIMDTVVNRRGEQMIEFLMKVNTLLGKTFDILDAHPKITGFLFWAGTITSAVMSMVGAFSVFYSIIQAGRTASALGNIAAALPKLTVPLEEAAASASLAWGAILGPLAMASGGMAVGAGISATLLHFRDPIDKWMKSHLGFSGDVYRKGDGSKNDTAYGQPAPSTQSSTAQPPSLIDTSKIETLLMSVAESCQNMVKELSKPEPLQPSGMTKHAAGWNAQPAYHQ